MLQLRMLWTTIVGVSMLINLCTCQENQPHHHFHKLRQRHGLASPRFFHTSQRSQKHSHINEMDQPKSGLWPIHKYTIKRIPSHFAEPSDTFGQHTSAKNDYDDDDGIGVDQSPFNVQPAPVIYHKPTAVVSQHGFRSFKRPLKLLARPLVPLVLPTTPPVQTVHATQSRNRVQNYPEPSSQIDNNDNNKMANNEPEQQVRVQGYASPNVHNIPRIQYEEEKVVYNGHLKNKQQRQPMHSNWNDSAGLPDAEQYDDEYADSDIVEFNENARNEYVIDEKKLRTDNLRFEKVSPEQVAQIVRYEKQQEVQQSSPVAPPVDDRKFEPSVEVYRSGNST